MNGSSIKATWGFLQSKEKLIAVNFKSDDNKYRTMKEMRRNRRSIAAMALGSLKSISNFSAASFNPTHV
jgi:hypothetical protein